MGREGATDQGHQGVAHPVRNPGIDPVGDDIVEGVLAEVGLGDVGMEDLDVGQAQGLNHGLTAGDGGAGDVEAHEPRVRESHGHGDQIGAVAAPDIQEPKPVQGREGQAEQHGVGRETIRMGLAKGDRRIGDFVVRRRPRHVASAFALLGVWVVGAGAAGPPRS